MKSTLKWAVTGILYALLLLISRKIDVDSDNSVGIDSILLTGIGYLVGRVHEYLSIKHNF